MKWIDAIRVVVKERIDEMGMKQTSLAEKSQYGLSRNFFTRLFNGDMKRVDVDTDLEPLALTLGFAGAEELIRRASQKKTA